MDPARLLHHETFAFLLLLAATLAYRALTGRLQLSGLLSDEQGNPVTPERVQLLLATLAVSAFYLRAVVHGSGTALPDVSTSMLVVFGSSGSVYTMAKAARVWAAGTN